MSKHSRRLEGETSDCAPNTNILMKLELNSDNIISFMDAYPPASSSTAWETVIDVVFSSLNFASGTCKFMYGDNTQSGGEYNFWVLMRISTGYTCVRDPCV